ncbi:GNAT family N-acetyltransferase [Clostridium sp. AL.422]|uniref:GNAT family N-acetyltransferase n=1 Tax=Clostridium TaxID=1485 RepID=UPI00293DE269|nr:MULTISPECIES: GNAT family N-acetyltransferase [unclassified Clostridium]MDV4152561.1 GNAT family N-acetyltransferase [Clostridium sp. AL.422]
MNDINLYRRNGKLIYIKMPEFNELAFVKELWGNRKNMNDVGGVYSFPEEKWGMFYKKMVSPTDGKNFYCLIYDLNDKPIGEVSFHGYNSATKVARINVKVHYEHRRKGYGEEALRLLLEYYFFEFGGQAIIDSVKNDEGKFLLKKIGFEELNNFRNQGTYKLTKNKFMSFKANNKISVAVLSYDNIDLTEYFLPFNIFNKVNGILKEDYFNVYSICDEFKIKSKYDSIEIKHNANDCDVCPDILIVPGGSGVEKAIKDKVLLAYINKVFSHCDYIVTFSSGVYFLNEIINMDGISIPNSKYQIDGVNRLNKDFVDNGKIMISNKLVGHIELCMNLVKKIAGDEVSMKLAEEIGYLF